MDPLKDGECNVLVLSDTFSKFSHVLVTSNQNALTVAKIILDKWFCIYSMPAHNHNNKGWSFYNEILEHLYILYMVRQSKTTIHNPSWGLTCERINCILHDLLRSLDKKNKRQIGLCMFQLWCLPTMLCLIVWLVTSYMSWCFIAKHQLSVVHGSVLAKYNNQYLQSKCTWVSK